MRERWGTDAFADETLDLMPTLAGDEEFRIWNRNWDRLSASPSGAYAYWTMLTEIEFRDIYPAVHVPTLVLYRAYRPDAREIYGDVARLIPMPAWSNYRGTTTRASSSRSPRARSRRSSATSPRTRNRNAS